jgi:hypothetical protein
VSFGVPSLELSPFACLFQMVTLSIFRRRGNELVSMRPRCSGLWTSNSGRLQYWREWWPTLSPRLENATHIS